MKINKKIYLGRDINNKDIKIDFDEEKINFILLAGGTNTGKSVFHNNLYKQLTKIYTPKEVSFVFLDMTVTDFNGWQSVYLCEPITVTPKEAISLLHKIAKSNLEKKIFIHIEECDIVYFDIRKLEKALDLLKKKDNVYIVYSTSRIDPSYLKKWINKYIDLRVIFKLYSKESSNLLTEDIRDNDVLNFEYRGERLLLYNGKKILCNPFSDKETSLLTNFKLSD